MSRDDHFLNDPSFLNSLARHAGVTQGSHIWNDLSFRDEDSVAGRTVIRRMPPPSFYTPERSRSPEPGQPMSLLNQPFESEDLRRRSARDETRQAIRKPSRGASLEAAIREIATKAAGRTDPVVRLAAIETLAEEAIKLLRGSTTIGSEPSTIPADPNDARDDLLWRQACDEAYTDGMVARKCGIGQDDHGLAMDTDRSAGLAQAFRLGWAVADAEAARDDVIEAARLVLKFGDADSRDLLRTALSRLSPPF